MQRTHLRMLLQSAKTTGDLNIQTDALLALLDAGYTEHKLNYGGHVLETLGQKHRRAWHKLCKR